MGRSCGDPPDIIPNYGKPKSILPKSRVSRVVLHENICHEHLLQARLSQISLEARRAARLADYHRKSFLQQQAIRQQQLRQLGIHCDSFIPVHIAEAYVKMAKLGRDVYRTSPENKSLQRIVMQRHKDMSEQIAIIDDLTTTLACNDDGHKKTNISNGFGAKSKSPQALSRQVSYARQVSNVDSPFVSHGHISQHRSSGQSTGRTISTSDYSYFTKQREPLAGIITTSPRQRNMFDNNPTRSRDENKRFHTSTVFTSPSNLTSLWERNAKILQNKDSERTSKHTQQAGCPCYPENKTLDVRFKLLKNSLFPASRPVDGYLLLSMGSSYNSFASHIKPDGKINKWEKSISQGSWTEKQQPRKTSYGDSMLKPDPKQDAKVALSAK